jgi:hypothetical protein
MAQAEDEHDHPQVRFVKTEVDPVTLGALRLLHPALADNLLLCQRFDALNEDEKRLLTESQAGVESFPAWTPGFHAAGDMCAACGTPVQPLFTDRFERGKLAYAAFVGDVPVHARKECIGSAPAPASPQARDQLRRRLTMDRARPSARMAQFFRADALAKPPFELEDWANGVAHANDLDKATVREVERLLAWVHGKLFH